MYGADGTPPPARVFLRVTPRECVRFSEGAPVEAEGWFRAAGIYDGAVQANLELGRPCTIEYELRPGDSSTPARLALRIRGARDWLLEKDLIVSGDIRNTLAALASIPLVIWIMVGGRRRTPY